MLKHPFVQIDDTPIKVEGEDEIIGSAQLENASFLLAPTAGSFIAKRSLSTVMENSWLGGSISQSAVADSDSDDDTEAGVDVRKSTVRQLSKESGGSDSGTSCHAGTPRSSTIAGAGVGNIVLLAPDPNEPLNKTKRSRSKNNVVEPIQLDSPNSTLTKHNRKSSQGSNELASTRSRITPSPIEVSEVLMSPIPYEHQLSNGARRINVSSVYAAENRFDYNTAPSNSRSQTPVS